MDAEFSYVSYLFSEEELCALLYLSNEASNIPLPVHTLDMAYVEQGLNSLEERGRLIQSQNRQFVDKVLLFLCYCIASSACSVVASDGMRYIGVFTARRATICVSGGSGKWMLTPFEQPEEAVAFLRDQSGLKMQSDTFIMHLHRNGRESISMPFDNVLQEDALLMIENWLSSP